LAFEWLSIETVVIIHDEQLAEHGGAEGLRDRALLESALARPQTLAAYGGRVKASALAAAYAGGIVRNHPFVDGNKRTGWLAAATFLALNGFSLEAPQPGVVVVVEALAAGAMSEAEFASWLEAHVAPGG